MRRFVASLLFCLTLLSASFAGATTTRDYWLADPPNATLDLNFPFYLPGLVADSRASSAWDYNSAKSIAAFGSNVAVQPVFDTTGNARGLGVWPGKSNVLHNSTAPATQTVTVTNATAYVFWCGGGGTITLSGAASQTVTCSGWGGFYAYTSASTSLTATVATGSPSFEQNEPGTTPSPPIVTASGTVTRNADVVSAPVATWFANGSVGTVVVTFSVPFAPSGNQAIFQIDDNGGNDNNRIFAKMNNTGTVTAGVTIGGTATSITTTTTVSTSAKNTVALSYGTGKLQVQLNSERDQAAGAGSLPSVSVLRLGMDATSQQCACYLQRFTYIPAALNTQQLLNGPRAH